MWTLSLLGVLHSLSHTLHVCFILLGFLSPCFVCVHDALGFLFVDTTACMLDVLRFVFRTQDKDCAVVAALLMVLKIICVLSAGTNPTPDNIYIHRYLFAQSSLY